MKFENKKPFSTFKNIDEFEYSCLFKLNFTDILSEQASFGVLHSYKDGFIYFAGEWKVSKTQIGLHP